MEDIVLACDNSHEAGIGLASHGNGTRSWDGYSLHVHIPTWHSIETATPIWPYRSPWARRRTKACPRLSSRSLRLVPVKRFMRLADAGLSMKAITPASIGSGGGWRKAYQRLSSISPCGCSSVPLRCRPLQGQSGDNLGYLWIA